MPSLYGSFIRSTLPVYPGAPPSAFFPSLARTAKSPATVSLHPDQTFQIVNLFEFDDFLFTDADSDCLE
jgi:hypothetical protein